MSQDQSKTLQITDSLLFRGLVTKWTAIAGGTFKAYREKLDDPSTIQEITNEQELAELMVAIETEKARRARKHDDGMDVYESEENWRREHPIVR